MTNAVEGVEDAKFITQVAHYGRKKVMELKTEANHFRPAEFVDKVVGAVVEVVAGTVVDKMLILTVVHLYCQIKFHHVKGYFTYLHSAYDDVYIQNNLCPSEGNLCL